VLISSAEDTTKIVTICGSALKLYTNNLKVKKTGVLVKVMNFKGYKMDGLGNDFLIIDQRAMPIALTADQIKKLGNRNNIGFDQLIYINPGKNSMPDILFYNSDGGESAACGNGSRCIAYLLGEKNNSKSIKIKTNNRTLNAEIVGKNSVKLNMGKPLFNWEKIPLSKNLDHKKISIDIDGKSFEDGFCVNVGNPHIIFFVKDCMNVDLKTLGPKIENHNLFPERTNVTFAEIAENNLIKVNVWERGAGLTKACGTAACATAVAAYKNEFVGNKVDIQFKEGL